MNLIKIEKKYIKIGTRDIYINTDYITSIEDPGFNECVIKLLDDSAIIIKVSAQDFIDFLNSKGIIKHINSLYNEW